MTEDPVLRMQQAARQRVQNAREQARRIVEENNRCMTVPVSYGRPSHREKEPCYPVPAKPCEVEGGIGEQGLLLLLAFFLYRNHAAPEIILAILYLAL